MAKKKQTLPDIKNQDPLEPINIAELGSNSDPCLVLVMTYQLKNVNYAETQNYVHSRCHRI